MTRPTQGEQVWARNAFRRDVHWPAVVVDADKDAPETVRKSAVPGRVCVMYYGPSTTATRQRDFYWRSEEDILRWGEGAPGELEGQKIFERDREAFLQALEEGKNVTTKGLLRKGREKPGRAATERSQGAQGRSHCTSCNIFLSPEDRASEQEGRCQHCHRLFMEGHYCKICSKAWIQSDHEMVACDKCNMWVHTNCDSLSIIAVEASKNRQGCTYFCPICRDCITHQERVKLAFEYEAKLRELKPTSRPETGMSIFAGEVPRDCSRANIRMDRNMYAGMTDEIWRALPQDAKAKYHEQAKQQEELNQLSRARYQTLLADYKKLAEPIGHAVPVDLELDLTTSRGSLGVKRPGPSLNGMREQKQACVSQPGAAGGYLPTFDRARGVQWMPPIGQGNSAFSHFNPGTRGKEECGDGPRARDRASVGAGPRNDSGEDDKEGVIQQRVVCGCTTCKTKAESNREFTATQFEQHCGAGSAKKWKSSLRIQPGTMPEVPEDAPPLPLGKWFDMKGIDMKSIRGVSRVPVGTSKNYSKDRRSMNRKIKVEKKPEELEPWKQVLRGGYTTMKVRYAGDRCTVCDGDVDYDCDQLITCDGCGCTVHQTCYGIQEAPTNDQIWLCAVCERHKEGEPRPKCCLCPIEGGALKPTDMPGLWAHVACMQWIPEVTVGDPLKMEPIQRVAHIQKERWELTCSLCKQRMGAKIQCLQCYSTYHPLCARMAGLYMEMQEGRSEPTGPLKLVTYCPRHCKPRPELAGVHKVKDPGEEQAVELFNRQPFKQPPAVDVPVCPSGCARSQSLRDWERMSHGTGAGFSTAKAFWIPEPPKHLHKAPAGVKQRDPFSRINRIRPNRPRSTSRKDKVPVGPVDLLPLPKGVPETITVECNGHRGTLLIRSQRVTFMNEEMTASRFEQTCGKGEAKKWKCSLWHAGENGEPPTQMQEWLAKLNLDRKVLSNLQSNLAAYNMYQRYIDSQVEDVVFEMVDSVDSLFEEKEGALTAEGDVPPGKDCTDSEVRVNLGSLNADSMGVATLGSSPVNSADMTNSDHTVSHEEPTTAPGTTEKELDKQKEGITRHQHYNGGGPAPVDTLGDELYGDLGGSAKANVVAARSDLQRDIDCEKGRVEEAVSLDEETAAGRPVLKCVGKGDEAQPDRMDVDSEHNNVGTTELNVNGMDCDEFPANGNTEQYEVKLDGEVVQRGDDAGAGPSCLGKPEKLDNNIHVRLGARVKGTETTSPVLQCLLRRTDSHGSTVVDPASCVNRACQLYWPDDDEWYSAVVKENRKNTSEFLVMYHIDGEKEWLDLQVEMDEGRLEWVVEGSEPMGGGAQGNKAPEFPKPSSEPAGNNTASQMDCDNPMATKSVQMDNNEEEVGTHGQGADAIGQRIAIWWRDDHNYYPGAVTGFDEESGKYHIRYDDGEEEWLDLSKEDVQWQAKPPRPKRASRTRSNTNSAQWTDPQPCNPTPNPNVPDEVPIVCNGLEAQYNVKKISVTMKDGTQLTPTEFERTAGKGSSKKWKASIRMRSPEGGSGITLGDWLIDQGLDVPRNRSSRASEDDVRRAPKKMNTPSERRKPQHRQNCMCIICKQARRKGVISQYPTYASHEKPPGSLKPAAPQSWRPATTAAAARAVGPGIRSGKRAYVQACPQFVRGPSTHLQKDIPLSRCWSPEELFRHQRAKLLIKDEEGSPVAVPGAVVDDKEAPSVKGEEGVVQGSSSGRVRRGFDGRIIRSKTDTWRIQLKECQETEGERIAFGKSGIHGWGLFARKKLLQDDMIIEYRGEVVGPAVADLREKQYKSQGKDCYLFHINDDHVIDATVTGAIGRFTNHSCAPSLYTKILNVDGQYHLCFFARYDIQPGQELTYDYRFKEEAAENKIPCQCGAPNCRGFMN